MGRGRKAERIKPRGALGNWFQSIGGKISTSWEKGPHFLSKKKKGGGGKWKKINFDNKDVKS